MSFCIRDRRFDVFLYTPADKQTEEYCKIISEERRLVSHLALISSSSPEETMKFLLNHLISKTGTVNGERYYRYVMNRPGKKEDLLKILGEMKTRFHIRDWDDVRKGSYENGKFAIKKVLAEFRDYLEDSNMIKKINRIDSVSEVSGQTLRRDREGMLFWEKNMEKILSEVFPERHLRFGFICVYQLKEIKDANEFQQIEKLHDTIWYLPKDNTLKTGKTAIAALEKRNSIH